jgi:hypothetical protein
MALGKMGTAAKEAVPAIRELLHDIHPGVRKYAGEVLATLDSADHGGTRTTADRIVSGFGEATVCRLQPDPEKKFRDGFEMKTRFRVKDGTRCKEDKAYEFEESDWKQDWAKVTILEGDNEGKVGWILRAWLKSD